MIVKAAVRWMDRLPVLRSRADLPSSVLSCFVTVSRPAPLSLLREDCQQKKLAAFLSLLALE